MDEQVQKMSCRAAVRLVAWPKNIKVENLTFFMTLWNILGWSVSILVGLFYLENLSRKQNHMGTEFLWLRDKCLTSESWQEMIAINCFNVTSIQLHQNSNKDFGFFIRDPFLFHNMKYCWTWNIALSKIAFPQIFHYTRHTNFEFKIQLRHSILHQ